MNTCDEQLDPSPVPLRDLSHDLRTPMAVIRMQAQYLLRVAGQLADLRPADRARFEVGLTRIDDAVTALNRVLERYDETVGPEIAPAREEPADLH